MRTSKFYSPCQILAFFYLMAGVCFSVNADTMTVAPNQVSCDAYPNDQGFLLGATTDSTCNVRSYGDYQLEHTRDHSLHCLLGLVTITLYDTNGKLKAPPNTWYFPTPTEVDAKNICQKWNQSIPNRMKKNIKYSFDFTQLARSEKHSASLPYMDPDQNLEDVAGITETLPTAVSSDNSKNNKLNNHNQESFLNKQVTKNPIKPAKAVETTSAGENSRTQAGTKALK